jgi:hypothetical protein
MDITPVNNGPTLSDGDGGLSAEAVKRMQVT